MLRHPKAGFYAKRFVLLLIIYQDLWFYENVGEKLASRIDFLQNWYTAISNIIFQNKCQFLAEATIRYFILTRLFVIIFDHVDLNSMRKCKFFDSASNSTQVTCNVHRPLKLYFILNVTKRNQNKEHF